MKLILILGLAVFFPGGAAAAEKSGDAERLRLLTDLLIEARRFDEAEDVVRQRHETHPEDVSWALLMARINSARGQALEAARYYRESMKLEGEKPEILKQAGLEYFYGGDMKNAASFLEKAYVLLPGDADIAFALAELHFALYDKAAGRRWALEALRHLPEKSADPEIQRRRLKMRARLDWNEEINAAYQSLSADNPRNLPILLDWIDGSLEHQGLDQMEKALALLKERFPEKGTESSRYRLALGELYLRARRWREGIALLDQTPGSPWTRELLREAHHEYDWRLGGIFRYYQLPLEKTYEQGLRYGGYLSDMVKLEGELLSGSYQVPELGFNRLIESGQVSVSYVGPFWKLGGVGGFSAGGPNNAFSPGVFARYQPKDASSLVMSARYQYQRFWNDFAQAVSAGGLADEGRMAVETFPVKRVYLNGNYLYNQYRTKNDSSARRMEAMVETGYVVWEKPTLTAGYQYILEDTEGRQAFFEQIPLLRRARTHFLTFSYSRWWTPGLRVDAYFFNGQDSGRHLEFFHGALLGMGGNVHWEISPRFHAQAGYAYGRQSALIGAAGESHEVKVLLEARYFGH